MIGPIIKLLQKHSHQGTLKWHMVVRMIILHIMAIIGIFKIFYCSYPTLLWTYIVWVSSELGITVGAHRLWSHRSFQASFPVRVLLMLLNSTANQGTILHWSRDHRVHHLHSDTESDPHDSTRGFFFSHIGWLMVQKKQSVIDAGKKLDLSDLYDDPVVVFQERFSPFLPIFMCFFLPAKIASLCWGEDYWNAFFVVGGLRYCIGLHCTFLVNSAAHMHGDHPYDISSMPAENPVVSLLTLGEGWHNWHHKYPFDYAASEFGILKQFNVSKLVIDLLAALGLVWGRKRGTAVWKMGIIRRERNAVRRSSLSKEYSTISS